MRIMALSSPNAFGRTLPTNLTLFEAYLKQRKIRYKLIRPCTPQHNGKVERSHRKDNECFYASHLFYSFEDFKAQLAIRSCKYNAFSMRPLNCQPRKRPFTTFLPLV